MRTFVPLSDTLEASPPADSVLIEYGRKAIIAERRSFEGHFDEALRMVRAREFYSMTELARYFDKTSAWSSRLKECVLRQGLMTLNEWAMSFQRRRDGKGRPASGLDGMSLNEQRVADSVISLSSDLGMTSHEREQSTNQVNQEKEN